MSLGAKLYAVFTQGAVSRLGSSRRRSCGFTLVETSVTLGIVGALSLGAVSVLDCGSMDLSVAQSEFQGSLDQAFHLARERGTNVTVALADEKAKDIVPLHLSSRLKWGKPASIPLPPDMDKTVQAEATGEAHPKITVTPRHTATATTWFLNDGREAVCMRLSGKGHVQVLRWHRSTKKWSKV